MNGRSPSGWLRWITCGSLVLGLGALVATVWVVGLATISSHLRAIGGWFLVLVAFEALATCCDAGAVFAMTRGPGAPSFRQVLVAQFAGRAINSVTPGANLGEAIKVGLLARSTPPRRIVAAVMYVALATIGVGLVAVALGTASTAFLFDVPLIGMFALLGAAAVAGGIALAIVWLVRRGMLTTLSRLAARLHLISRTRRQRWATSLEDLGDPVMRPCAGSPGGRWRTVSVRPRHANPAELTNLRPGTDRASPRIIH